jgi:hypothetical protein
MKCYLTGMPELRLGLNDKVMFESTGRSTFLSSSFSPIFRSNHSHFARRTWEGNRDGGCQIPSMRPTRPL